MAQIVINNEQHFGKENQSLVSVKDIEVQYKELNNSEIASFIRWNSILYLISASANIVTIVLWCYDPDFKSYSTIINMFASENMNKDNISYELYYSVSKQQTILCWSIVWLLLGLFAYLPCIYKRENFISICCSHIGLQFVIAQLMYIMLICILLLKSLFHYETEKNNLVVPSIILVVFILAMKLHVHSMIYNRVKYLDEGQDYVGLTEFSCLHANFAIYSCMLTYMLLIAGIHTYIKLFDPEEPNCYQYSNYRHTICIAMILESYIYLAKFKDVIYALFTCQIMAGIYSAYYQLQNAIKGKDKDSKEDEDAPREKMILLVCVLSEIVAVILTFAYHHKSTIYIKYKDWASLIYGKGRSDDNPNAMKNKLENIHKSKDYASILSEISADSASVLNNY